MLKRPASTLLAMVSCLGFGGYASANAEEWSFDVEIRERAQFLDSPAFDGSTEEDEWRWTQRLAASAEGPITPNLRGRANLQSAVSSGGQTSPVESNVFDVREAFLDLGSDDLFLRVGRQEVLLGSQRLVGTRDGTNVRRGWDGLRGVVHAGDWRIDALALALVEVEPDGVFNDHPDDGRILGGVYATGPAQVGGIDFYLLYAEFGGRATIEGVADQRRYSLGARSFGERGQVFWDWEAIYQWGRHGSFDISAWTLAANTGYRIDAPWSPEVLISTNIASGDGGSGDGELGTFDALFPRGNYFSDAAILGPSNFYNINPYLRLSPNDRLDLSVDVNLFWRLRDTDGVYSPAGNLIRTPSGSRSNFVTTGVSARARYQIAERVSFEVIYSNNSPGTFIAETGQDDPVNFLELTFRVSL